jgi:hypothetical protein
MTTQVTLEELEEQVNLLSPQDQLKLVAYISERLSAMPLTVQVLKSDEAQAEQARLAKIDALLADLDKVAELWEGEFDSAADLRRIRDEDEASWPL